MKIEKGITKSKILTDNPELLRRLREIYSFKIPGIEYSPQYKRGWDGKKYFINKDGEFPTGLLESILEDLSKIECFPDIEQEYEELDLEEIVQSVEGFTYYDYQEALIERALLARRGVIQSSTGSGKTLILAGIVASLQRYKGTILFRSKSILVQTYEYLKKCGIQNLGLCFGEGFIEDEIMLCTAQSIGKILDHVIESEFLLVDEVHEFSQGGVSVEIINSFPNATFRFGFTATVPKDKIRKHNLLGAFGETISEVSTKDLIGKGKLAKPTINIIEMPDLEVCEEVKQVRMSYPEIYSERVVNSDLRNGYIKNIVDTIKKKNGKARILVIVKSLLHGRNLEELLGSSSTYIEGINSTEERLDAINKFRRARGNSILIGTTILQTGIDIKEITHYINARGLKSEIATLQALGRALRINKEKKTVYVYDILDKDRYLEKHSRDRIRHYKREGHKVQYVKFK